MPRESVQTATVLSNAGATGSAVTWDGGKALVTILAGTGGATVALQILGPNGSTYVNLPGASVTVDTAVVIDLPAGTYRGAVTGGTTPAGIYVQIKGVL